MRSVIKIGKTIRNNKYYYSYIRDFRHYINVYCIYTLKSYYRTKSTLACLTIINIITWN